MLEYQAVANERKSKKGEENESKTKIAGITAFRGDILAGIFRGECGRCLHCLGEYSFLVIFHCRGRE